MTEGYLYIDSDNTLVELCDQLHHCHWLAIDTEFFRVNTYYPELCLLQIANKERVAIIDPLTIKNIEPLYKLIYNTSITKVFHSARQDLELFFHLKRAIPTPLYDTQIAAGCLAYDSQIGYANLVKEILGVDLAKSQTRTNWKRRPLSQRQLNYAADDVIYLAQLYEVLIDKIKTPEQLAILNEEFKALDNPLIYEPEPENMWRKIKETRSIKGETLLIIKRLAAWREITARFENTPRKWILPDFTLVEMAKRLPPSLDELGKIKGMDDKIKHQYGEALLAIIADGSKGDY